MKSLTAQLSELSVFRVARLSYVMRKMRITARRMKVSLLKTLRLTSRERRKVALVPRKHNIDQWIIGYKILCIVSAAICNFI